jgi:predicted mannosyl-3-phosphoglycerate phosphatase (HAD superfamily)
MSDDFKPGDFAYTIIPPSSLDGDVVVVHAIVKVVGHLFESMAASQREEAQQVTIELETKTKIEEFRTNMTLLEKRLEADYQTELERQRSWFAIAASLVEQGKDQAAIAVLEIFSKEGRKSIVQELIDYHEKIGSRLSENEAWDKL